MKQVHADMIISDILRVDAGLEDILFQSGMHCLGCPSSQMESLGDACEVHGINPEVILSHLNEFLQNKGKVKK